MQKNIKSKENLMDQIERKRQEMITLSQVNGISSREVLRCSEELDVLIIKYKTARKQTYRDAEHERS